MSTKTCVNRPARPVVVCSLIALCGLAAGLARADDCDAVSCQSAPAPAASPARDDHPSSARHMMLLAQVGQAAMDHGIALCFVSNPSDEQLTEILERYKALPPQWNGMAPRFFTDSPVWTGNGQQAASGRSSHANLTFSFPADGTASPATTLWGSPASAPNNLNATLTTVFGAGNLDKGHELLRQALASWRRFNAVTYTEVADDNSNMTSSTGHTSVRGDVRIGCISQGTSSGVLAYDLFPSGGADMTLNSDQFGTGAMGGPGNNYRYLRNVVSHEHGHGLGFIHPVPCDGTKLMEPFINTNFDGTQIDEIRGAGNNYGDKYSGNNSGANAHDFGNLTTPVVHSVIERNLSTNGAANTNGVGNNIGEDWFKFTIDTAQNVTVTATPTGGTYTEGEQTSGCSGTLAAVAAVQAGYLAVELRNGTNGATVVQNATTAAIGTPETVTMTGLAAGTYWIRVYDQGPNASANQNVQSYDLTLRVGASHAPPFAIAGVNKRVLANTNCYFIGNIWSYAVDGATLLSSGYSWDLDGDGVFGGSFDSTAAQPIKIYVSNGTYPVTLRVTDSTGLTATDTINVVVYGATASITAVSPTFGAPNQSIPVTITGANFKGITSASQVTVSGSSVTVGGTPVVNALGTQITGLSFNVIAGAAQGTYDIHVTNSDGSNSASGTGTGAALFTVNANCVQPSITQSPQDTSACSGGTVTFTMAASGSSPTYQWRKGGAPVSGANISGATSSTLTISPVGIGDAGLYDCVATNGCGVATTTGANLYFGTITINTEPTPFTTVCPGASVTFSIVASGATSYQWQFNGDDIPDATDPTLTINPVSQDDAGGYNCQVSSSCGSRSSNTANLTVRAPTMVTIQPVPTSVCDGTSTALSLTATGVGRTYQWRKEGQPITGATTATLSFNPATTTDAGNYDCVVTGACGSDTSVPVTLSVCSVVSVTSSPTDVHTCLGGSATFMVGATGTNLSYQWRLGGVEIPGATGGTLTINPVGQSDLGSYDCVVSNCCQTAPPSGAANLSACAADYNCSGTLNVQDIFDFLSGWFSGSPHADFNGVNGITVQDIFDFLAAWFAGC